MRKKILSIVSGGFDPIHSGHISMFKHARKIGDELLVIVNNDNFLIGKKGTSFMTEDERLKIVESIKFVDKVFLSIDKDSTVSSSLEKINEKYSDKYNLVFANGGDRNDSNVPEQKICNKLKIDLVFEVGNEKILSSSQILQNYISSFSKEKNYLKKHIKPWGYFQNLYSSESFLVKVLSINEGEEISYQSHKYRAEFWYILEGNIEVKLDGKTSNLSANETISIPHKSKHQIINNGTSVAKILEIQKGKILSENDIIRFEDKYNRTS